jgi:hypothetical protein
MGSYVRYVIDVDIGTLMNFKTGERSEGVFFAKVYEMDDRGIWPKKATPYELLRSPDGTRDGAALVAAAFIADREKQRERLLSKPHQEASS